MDRREGGHLVPLGQEIGDMVEAVRDRVEVSTHGDTWHVTAGSFDSALAYARERFDAPVVLSRTDRGRWWPRVTLVVTEDAAYAAAAPDLEDLAHPVALEVEAAPEAVDTRHASDMPQVLEEIFARQDRPPPGAHRVPRPRRGS
jgi:hypothetical protein